MKKIVIVISSALCFFLFSCDSPKSQKVYTGVVEGTAIQIPAMTGGKIVELFIEEGQQVKAGQPVALIDTLELSYQRENLQGLLQEIDSQEQSAAANVARARKRVGLYHREISTLQ